MGCQLLQGADSPFPFGNRPCLIILSDRLAGAVDELCVQMLGTKVLFGFQLARTFRPRFEQLSPLAHRVDVVALFGIVCTLAALIGAPAQCRLVERGDASIRVPTATGLLAAAALLFLSVTLSCDGFIVTQSFFGTAIAIGAGVGVFVCALLLWFALGWWLKRKAPPPHALPAHEVTPLHQKIKQMLREAWVVLPGATGILGFQLMISTTPAFKALPSGTQLLHFAALALIALTLMLVLTPAAIHRKAFGGADSPYSHLIGSHIISWALATSGSRYCLGHLSCRWQNDRLQRIRRRCIRGNVLHPRDCLVPSAAVDSAAFTGD